MMWRLRGFALATTSGWLIALGSVVGFGGVVLSPFLALALAVIAGFVAWAVDPRSRSGKPRVPLLGWLLYTVLLVGACAWHVHARERVFTVELWLPTMAVLLVLAPTFYRSRLSASSRDRPSRSAEWE